MKYCVNSAKDFLQLSRLIPILLLFLSRHSAQELSGYPWKLFACSTQYVVLALENWSKQSFTVYSDAQEDDTLIFFSPKWRTKN